MSNETKKSLPDHDSDPARTPGDGWVGEGGASHLGPATHTSASHAHGDDASGGEDDDDEEDGERSNRDPHPPR